MDNDAVSFGFIKFIKTSSNTARKLSKLLNVQLKDGEFYIIPHSMRCKFVLLFFDIFGGVLVSTGLFDLSSACGGFLVTS